MLDIHDYFIIALMVYLAVLAAGYSMGRVIYKLGMKRLQIVFNNDLPHYIDKTTARVVNNVQKKMRIMTADRIKQMKSAGIQPGGGVPGEGWGGVIQSFLQNPAIQNIIAEMVVRQQPPPPPQY